MISPETSPVHSPTIVQDIVETDATIEDHRVLNAFLPIARLNDDILSHIFILNAHIDFVHLHIPSTTTRRTSHVCQRWRDILLNYPLVWATSLEFADPKPWIDVVLARAGNAPLNIVLPSISHFLLYSRDAGQSYHQGFRDICSLQPPHLVTPPTDDELDFALSLLPRCRQLVITVNSQNKAQTVSRQTALLAGPNLEECTLSVYIPTETGLRQDGVAVDLEPPNTTHLKCLHLDGYSTKFPAPVFQNLTKLHVANQSQGRSLAASEWLKILLRLRQLEELGFNNSLANTTSVSGHLPENNLASPKPVILARLQRLDLKGRCKSCHEMLSALKFPASCELSLHYRGMDYVSPNSAIMTELCKKVQASVQFQKITGLSLDLSWASRSCGLNNSRHTRFHDKIFSLVLEVDDYNTAWAMLPELTMDLIQIVSPGVNDLFYHTSYAGIPGHEGTMIEPFEQIHTLRLHSSFALDIIDGVQYEDFLFDPAILPRLSRIYLYAVDISDDLTVQNIVSLVQKRSEIKAPIRYILPKGCWGLELGTLVEKLKAVGVETELDESEEKTTFRILTPCL